MDDLTYQQWWKLHLRTARGEQLSAEEQRKYSTGLASLEHDDTLHVVADARQARDRWIAIDAEYSKLERRRQELDAEIAELESQLSQQTRQFLGVKE